MTHRCACGAALYSRQRVCGTCSEERRQARLRHTKAERAERRKATYERLKRQAMEVLGGVRCKRCGFSDLRALQIDHTNGGGSLHRKKQGIYSTSLYSRIIKYGSGGFQVLCANCNIIKKIEEEEMTAKIVEIPWAGDQVASLNAYQKSGAGHPFTGRRGRGERGAETTLIATREGWVEHEGGRVVQTWAHDFMADWSWKKWNPLGE